MGQAWAATWAGLTEGFTQCGLTGLRPQQTCQFTCFTHPAHTSGSCFYQCHLVCALQQPKAGCAQLWLRTMQVFFAELSENSVPVWPSMAGITAPCPVRKLQPSCCTEQQPYFCLHLLPLQATSGSVWCQGYISFAHEKLSWHKSCSGVPLTPSCVWTFTTPFPKGNSKSISYLKY